MSLPYSCIPSDPCSPILAGAATVDITPPGSVFLFGYPHVLRFSTGVHDSLECAALFVRAQEGQVLFLANDLIYIPRDFARDVRERIAVSTGVPLEAIMLTATHTHSGPVMKNNLVDPADSVVPKVDSAYLHWLSGRIVDAARSAVGSAVPAEIGFAVARAEGVGTNRHDPAGPTDPEVPVFVARSLATGQPLACMVIYGMHPTVLHEDSTQISADFPGFTRRWLRGRALPAQCPVVYHQGAAGNQSPRHITHSNTFAEAQRIGENLGRAVAGAIERTAKVSVPTIVSRREMITVEPREIPSMEAAQHALAQARAKFESLRVGNAPRQEIRSAECDVFGAERTAELSRAAGDGRLAAAIDATSPAELQLIAMGPLRFVGWPGEFFAEHALALKAKASGVFVITLANGELGGYIATPTAASQGAYEATNALFTVGNGPRFVEQTLTLLASIGMAITGDHS